MELSQNHRLLIRSLLLKSVSDGFTGILLESNLMDYMGPLSFIQKTG